MNTSKYTTSPFYLLTRSRDMSLFLGDKEFVKSEHKHLSNIVGSWTQDSTYWATQTMKASFAIQGMSLLDFAVWQNDMAAVKFLVKKQTHYFIKSKSDNGDYHKFITVSFDIFKLAVKNGQTEMLGFFMLKMGIGFPFPALMEEAGVKVKTKQKYYQGLSVYRRKWEDWVTENVYPYGRSLQSSNSFLLLTITLKNLESVKWFLNNEPEKKYREFLHTFRDDSRLAPLFQEESGFEEMITSWLGNLALHCAVMTAPTEELGISLIHFILQQFPDSLHTKNADDLTSLHLAFAGQRIIATRVLVEAGAD
ncbi:uncharacterized protein PADG_12185 [Paracoccidioides brasiliensis Pb18]|uniref:Uncharacterized protein n=1 Tax=Paracoccidioides brasiliensis (strain Pb18) TaxID=502780 RepID=A0A0A0HSY1_PARBD|nr:uncharacterized protein PADG_12185 [Paracoccidioides brasiliensis Pb18]KGM91727.1 hypothetical protein PADG_12185 [Paracoccidioides brasiliensis Pb18]